MRIAEAGSLGCQSTPKSVIIRRYSRFRKIADRIYKDLVDERIGPQRAAMELQEMNKRRKGGQLVSKPKSCGGF